VNPTPEFFFTDRARAFFSLRAILTYVVRAGRRPGQVTAAAGGTAGTRGSWRAGARGREGGRAWQGGRTDVEKLRGVGGRGDGVRRERPKL